MHPQRGFKALTKHLPKDYEKVEGKLVLAASSRSAQAKSQLVEVLVESFILPPKRQ